MSAEPSGCVPKSWASPYSTSWVVSDPTPTRVVALIGAPPRYVSAVGSSWVAVRLPVAADAPPTPQVSVSVTAVARPAAARPRGWAFMECPLDVRLLGCSQLANGTIYTQITRLKWNTCTPAVWDGVRLPGSTSMTW